VGRPERRRPRRVARLRLLLAGLAAATLLPAPLRGDDAAAAEAATRQAYQDLDALRAEADALRAELEPYLDRQAAYRDTDRTQRAVDWARDGLRRARKADSYTEPPRGKDPRRASNAPRRRHPA
jgi:hypothetical protein